MMKIPLAREHLLHLPGFIRVIEKREALVPRLEEEADCKHQERPQAEPARIRGK